MMLNPFKDATLADLQEFLRERFNHYFGRLIDRSKELWKEFTTKGNERITVMFIPHSEKRIINFHITIFTIGMILIALTLTVTITSIMIIRHTSTTKEVSKLKKYGQYSKQQVARYRDEINRLYDVFQKLKPELTTFYALIPDSNVDSLWARGGIENPNPTYVEDADPNSPPIEVLNLQEVEKEIKTSMQVVKNIKTFVKYRKTVINSTPSVWPVEGYIVSRFGKRNSPYTFEQEYHLGIDIESYPGAEIKATAPGIVKSTAWDPIYGLTVTIKHKYGFETVYSHCQRITVAPDQNVEKNQVIGYLGRTGKTTQYICFYQVKVGTEFVDPLPYLNSISQ